MNFGEQRDLVRVKLNELIENKYKDANIKTLIDLGCKEFARETLILRTWLSLSWGASEPEYALSAVFARYHKSVKVIYPYGTADAKPLRRLLEIDLPWDTISQTGDTFGYYDYNDKMGLVNIPTAERTAFVIYAYLPTDLSAIGGTSQLPEEYHMAGVHYALKEIVGKFQDDNRYIIAKTEYKELVRRAKKDKQVKLDIIPGFRSQRSIAFGAEHDPSNPFCPDF